MIEKLLPKTLFLICSNFKAQCTLTLRLLMWELDPHDLKEVILWLSSQLCAVTEQHPESVVSV